MDNKRLDSIRAVIRTGDYEKARRMLEGMHTPETKHLLDGLDMLAPAGVDRAMRRRIWFWLAMLVAMSVFVVAAGVLVYVLSQPSPERFAIMFGSVGIRTEKSYEGEIDVVVKGTGIAPDGRRCDAYYIFEDAEGQPVDPPEAYPCLLVNGEPASALWVAPRAYDPDHAYRVTFDAPGRTLTFSAPEVSADEDGAVFEIEVHKK